MRASLFEVRSSVVWAEWWRRSGLFLRSRICFWALSMATSQPRTNALAHTLHSHTTNLDRGIRFGYLPDIRAHVFGKWLRHGKKKKKREREMDRNSMMDNKREGEMERVTDGESDRWKEKNGKAERGWDRPWSFFLLSCVYQPCWLCRRGPCRPSTSQTSTSCD